MLTATPYTAAHKAEWDGFAAKAKNGIFLFQRDYMEHHEERFVDGSLLFHQDSRLVALLPANRDGDTLVSHGWLTFGGFLTDASMTQSVMLELFAALTDHLREAGVKRLVYKCIPYVFHTLPAEEDRYALFRAGARLIRRDASSAIDFREPLKFRKGRIYCVKRARSAGVQVREAADWERFWEVLEENLGQRHGVKPAHTVQQIRLLHARFPNNIRLHVSTLGNQVLAGAVLFENTHSAHVQYISSTEQGRELGAVDILFDHLINERYCHKRYFSFGVSTTDAGQSLNEGLIAQKEGFGARTVVHDFYELEVG